jgi:hypothetical protein
VHFFMEVKCRIVRGDFLNKKWLAKIGLIGIALFGVIGFFQIEVRGFFGDFKEIGFQQNKVSVSKN